MGQKELFANINLGAHRWIASVVIWESNHSRLVLGEISSLQQAFQATKAAPETLLLPGVGGGG